jgi:hypothetical protein
VPAEKSGEIIGGGKVHPFCRFGDRQPALQETNGLVAPQLGVIGLGGNTAVARKQLLYVADADAQFLRKICQRGVVVDMSIHSFDDTAVLGGAA